MRQMLGISAFLVVSLGGCDDGTTPAVSGTDTAEQSDSADADGSSISDASISDAAKGPPGIGKSCLSDGQCTVYELKCIETNAATGEGICGKLCAGNGDCPSGAFCNPQGEKLICTLPRFCNPCVTAADCSGEDAVCLLGGDGKGYCSRRCTIGDNHCPVAVSCIQFGESIDDFACKPDYGSCKGGGEPCAPCATQADCGVGTQCYAAPDTGERFCAQTCDPASPAAKCPTGFGCADVKGKGYCFRIVPQVEKDKPPTKLVATCSKGDRGFCDSCAQNYECASGRCASKNNQKFCVQLNECSQKNQDKDCPYGGEATTCQPSDVGMICTPPPSWKCQGFKACLGHACGDSETCVNGICKAK